MIMFFYRNYFDDFLFERIWIIFYKMLLFWFCNINWYMYDDNLSYDYYNNLYWWKKKKLKYFLED